MVRICIQEDCDVCKGSGEYDGGVTCYKCSGEGVTHRTLSIQELKTLIDKVESRK